MNGPNLVHCGAEQEGLWGAHPWAKPNGGAGQTGCWAGSAAELGATHAVALVNARAIARSSLTRGSRRQREFRSSIQCRGEATAQLGLGRSGRDMAKAQQTGRG